MTIESFEAQIYPNLGPAKLTGYNGMSPGPTFIVEKGHESVARFLNKGSTDSVVHLHGSPSHSPWDGWADDKIQVGQWKDYYWPHMKATTLWYHDHAEGVTATNAYHGQAGAYIIHDSNEDALALPSGDYDIPLAITDKIYQSNGDLQSPSGETIGFLGDIIHVNDQPWPYLSVEPRKYRFRLFDMSLSRPYDLYLEDPNMYTVTFDVIGSDGGLFGGPVSTSDIIISPGERYEIIIDFATYAGSNITLKNKMQIPVIEEYDNTDKVMMFVVGDKVSDSSNNGAVPSTLNGAIDWPQDRDTVDHTFDFAQGGDGEWTINGVTYMDVNNRVLAKPPQGSVELWELRHTGGPAIHPVHIHLVNFQVISRTGGSRGVLPYESAGLKDVVLLEPGETVRVLAYYGPWNGLYMFHCHNLIHEDNGMMVNLNVTLLEGLGYDSEAGIDLADPLDPRYAPKDYSDQAFSPAAVSSAVAALASLNPYGAAAAVKSDQDAYYATAGWNGDEGATAATQAAASTTTAPGASGEPMSRNDSPTGAPSGGMTESEHPAATHGPPGKRGSTMRPFRA